MLWLNTKHVVSIGKKISSFQSLNLILEVQCLFGPHGISQTSTTQGMKTVWKAKLLVAVFNSWLKRIWYLRTKDIDKSQFIFWFTSVNQMCLCLCMASMNPTFYLLSPLLRHYHLCFLIFIYSHIYSGHWIT